MTDSDGKDPGGTDKAPEAPALAIIEAFGGIRPMAKQLGLAVSTVQGWKERSAIPANRHDQIRAAAQKNNIDIDPAVLRAAAPSEGAAPQPQVIEGKATPVPDKSSTEKDSAKKTASEKETADKASAATNTAGGDKPGHKAGDKAGGMSAASAASRAGARRAETGGSATPAAPRRAGFAPGLVAGVVLAVVVAGATVYTQPYWRGLFGEADSAQGQTAAALDDLEARLEDLRAALPADTSADVAGLGERVATLEAAVSQGGGQDPETRAALESLNAQMARQTDRLEALEQELSQLRNLAGSPSPELSSRLSTEAERLDQLLTAQQDLAARLAETEEALAAAAAARDAAPGSRETLMLLAMLQLRDALQGSGPYDQPLTMLQNLAGDDPALAEVVAPLERRATAGLPSLRDLQAGFPEVARRIAAIEVGQEGEGWSAGVLRRMAEAVNLRPVGLVEGDAATAVAARAEVKLNDGDLAGALGELDALQGAAAEAAASWRADAEARLAAQRAVSRLGALVSERFSNVAGG